MGKKWRLYKFSTKAVEDCRPLVFNPAYPRWHSGTGGDGTYNNIVAYLPANEPLERYWDDAYDVRHTEEDEIQFTDRFPKPEYYKPEGEG